jgi:hypothetical protein
VHSPTLEFFCTAAQPVEPEMRTPMTPCYPVCNGPPAAQASAGAAGGPVAVGSSAQRRWSITTRFNVGKYLSVAASTEETANPVANLDRQLVSSTTVSAGRRCAAYRRRCFAFESHRNKRWFDRETWGTPETSRHGVGIPQAVLPRRSTRPKPAPNRNGGSAA